MELILLRHGKAEDTHRDGDFMRALVAKGKEQARRAALHLKAAGRLPDIVLTSPLIRARQTAEEFCNAAEIPSPIVHDWLACGMTPATALSEFAKFPEHKPIMIVGHEPDLSDLIETLLGVDYGSVSMKKGAIACVEWNPTSTHGTLLYLIPPKLVGETGSEE